MGTKTFGNSHLSDEKFDYETVFMGINARGGRMIGIY